MHVGTDELEVLKKLQAVDLGLMKVRKSRQELPQRAQVAAILKKRAEIEAKATQLAAIKESAEVQLEKVEAEDAQLVEKQRRAQELIDNAGTDYRSIESHSRELSGFAKRRATLEEKVVSLSDELARTGALQSKINEALSTLAAQEQALREQFARQDGALAEQEHALAVQRAALAGVLSEQLLELYEATAAKANGVAVGELVDDRCGVCRSTIEGGRLIELHASAPLGVCPSCKRLLIVE